MKSRLITFLYGMEYVLDALICKHHDIVDVRALPDGGATFRHVIRRWHPSFWLGCIRCNWLGDKCGSAIYTLKKPAIKAT